MEFGVPGLVLIQIRPLSGNLGCCGGGAQGVYLAYNQNARFASNQNARFTTGFAVQGDHLATSISCCYKTNIG